MQRPKWVPPGSFLDYMEGWFEDWRKETMLERDGLLGGTHADNVRHVIVRGAVLDYFFSDDRINAIIEKWVNRTRLKDRVQQAASALAQISNLAKVPWYEVLWDGETGFLVTVDEDDESPGATVEEANAVIRSFLVEMKSFPTTDACQGVVGECIDLVRNLGLPYQWLVIEVLQVYLARLFVDGFSWQYTDNLEVEHSADSQPAPEVENEFRTRDGETVRQAVDRLNREAKQAIEELTRFAFDEVLPRGKVPALNRPTLKKYAKWCYLSKVAGKSIRSIAKEEFPGDSDRRKDVRDGIRRAEDLLSLGT